MTGKYFLHVLVHLQDKLQRRVKIMILIKREHMQTVAQNTNKSHQLIRYKRNRLTTQKSPRDGPQIDTN